MILVRDFRDVEAEAAVEEGKVVQGVTVRVVIGPKEGAPTFNMRVFEVEPGFATPYHSHHWEHEVFVLLGQGVVKTDEGEQPIRAGSTVFVPGGEVHQFENTGESTLRFICLIPQQ